MVLNLGPAWGKTDAYSLFANNVIEIPFKDWETPAGLGVCPLDVIFTACASISSWLNLDDENIVVCLSRQLTFPVKRSVLRGCTERPLYQQVLHTRSRSGLGMHFIRFLAACYLVFNMDFGNVTKALESLPPIALHRPASGLPGVFAICCRRPRTQQSGRHGSILQSVRAADGLQVEARASSGGPVKTSS